MALTWDDFILKMRQGEMIQNAGNDHYIGGYYAAFYCVPVNQSTKLVYYGNPGKQSDLFGILDCNNNDFYLMKDMESVLKLMGNVDHPSLKKLEDLRRKVLDLVISDKTDNFIKALRANGEQVILNNNVPIEFCEGNFGNFSVAIVQEGLQYVAMGLNNYVRYRLMDSLYKDDENDLNMILAIAIYLDTGILGLQKLNFKEWNREFGYIETIKKNYDDLCDSYLHYTNYHRNIYPILEHELREAIKDKGTVTINGEKVRDCKIDGSNLLFKNEGRREIPINDVMNVTYRGKEIYNRDKILEPIRTVEFQEGLNDLVKLAYDNFKKYNGKIKPKDYDEYKKNWSVGDLIYTIGGEFGIIIGGGIAIENEKEEGCLFYLYNGKKHGVAVNYIDFLLKEPEMNNGLRQIKKYIIDKFNKEQRKIVEQGIEIER